MALKDLWALLRKSAENMREASGASIDADEDDFVRLGEDKKRNLSGPTQRHMQEMAVYLWKTNPLAKALIELPLAYLLADGVKLTVGDEEAQGWLNDFWNDPINKMKIKLESKARELAIFGEQCWPVFVNEMNGDVRLGYLDPGQIATIVTDPDNDEQPIGVVTKKNRKMVARRYRIIINGPETVFSERTQKIRETFTDGECFYFTVNALSNSDRGHSDMLAQLDWLDAYDQAMFGEVERWTMMRSHIWDVTLKGANEEQVNERAKKIAPPKPGSVRLHNDAEVWAAVSPDLKSEDSSTNARLFRNHVLGGNTIPEHWYGGGGDVNRATAGEMGEPTVKVFTMRKNFLGYCLEEVGTFVLRKKLLAYGGSGADELIKDPQFQPKAEFPELTNKDTSTIATAFERVVSAVVGALNGNVLSLETAIELVAHVAGQLGLEIDAKAELEAVRDAKSKKEEQDVFVGSEDDLGDGE